MKKKVLGFVMAALAISTIGAYAQTPAQECTSTEQCQKTCNKDKKDKKDRKSGMRKGNPDRMNAFEGIELTADQQTKIQKLRAEQKANRMADKEAKKAAKKEAKEQSRKEYNEAVAKILTPEQYAQYQANCEKMKAQKKEKKDRKKEGKGDRAAKAKKGDKGDRAAKTAKKNEGKFN